MKKPLMQEYTYFLSIERELALEHDGKLVAIKGKEVLGIFDDYRQAANALSAEHAYGTVLLQPLSQDTEALTVVISTPGIVPVSYK
jgi:hypothetical protein